MLRKLFRKDTGTKKAHSLQFIRVAISWWERKRRVGNVGNPKRVGTVEMVTKWNRTFVVEKKKKTGILLFYQIWQRWYKRRETLCSCARWNIVENQGPTRWDRAGQRCPRGCDQVWPSVTRQKSLLSDFFAKAQVDFTCVGLFCERQDLCFLGLSTKLGI